jgi:hypothetical protein
MKYAITGPQGGVNRISDTQPAAGTFLQITDEQATAVVAGRAATPPQIYFVIGGALMSGEQKRAAAQAARLAEIEAQLEVSMSPAAYALNRAERLGIDVPTGEGNSVVRLACGDRDRALFSSALVLYRTYEDELPSEEAKAAFRASPVTFADVSGVPHQITVTQARRLIVAYGSIYSALWTAAATA